MAGTLPPELRIFTYLVLVLSLFFFPSLPYFAILLAILIPCLAQLPFRHLKAGWVPITMFLIFTFASNAFHHQGRILFSIGPLLMTHEALQVAAIRTARVFLMIGGVKFLMATSSVEAMIAALSRLLTPFERIGIPVKDFSHIMMLTLKCFPLLRDSIAAEYGRNIRDNTRGNLWIKARSLAIFLLPLFVESIRYPEQFFRGVNDCEEQS